MGDPHHNILRQAQNADPDDPFSQGLRRSYNELDAQRRAAEGELAELAAAEDSEPTDRPSADGLALLEALPRLRLTLHDAPEELQRQLYELTQLTVHVHHETEKITIMVRLPADRVDAVAATANAATAAPTQDSTQDVPTPSLGRVDAGRTPGAAYPPDDRTGHPPNRSR